MSKFIEVDSRHAKRRVYINVSAISDVLEMDDGCRIGLVGSYDNVYEVEQSYQVVTDMIHDALS